MKLFNNHCNLLRVLVKDTGEELVLFRVELTYVVSVGVGSHRPTLTLVANDDSIEISFTRRRLRLEKGAFKVVEFEHTDPRSFGLRIGRMPLSLGSSISRSPGSRGLPILTIGPPGLERPSFSRFRFLMRSRLTYVKRGV